MSLTASSAAATPAATAVQLPAWLCHKRVHASKIVGIFPVADQTSAVLRLECGATVEVDFRWQARHNASEGGYYVVYDDGYASFSPPGAFEAGYTPQHAPAAPTVAAPPSERPETYLEALDRLAQERLAHQHDAPAQRVPTAPERAHFPQALELDELELALQEADAQLLEPRAQFDQALLGFLESPNVAVYSAPKVIEVLMREQGMSHEDAREWFDFNIAASRGDGYPLYLWPATQAHAALTPAD